MQPHLLDRAKALLTNGTTSSESLDAKAPNQTSDSEDWKIPSPEWRQKHLGLDENHHPSIKILASTAEAYTRHCVRNRPRRSRWLVLGGNTGSGKTHASKRILARFKDCRLWSWEQGYWGGAIPNGTFWAWSTLSKFKDDEWNDIRDEISGVEGDGVDFLVLDDIGAEADTYKSGLPTVRLQEILDVMANRWLLVTTNVPRAQWAERWDERVASRLNSAAYISLFDVPDYRSKL